MGRLEIAIDRVGKLDSMQQRFAIVKVVKVMEELGEIAEVVMNMDEFNDYDGFAHDLLNEHCDMIIMSLATLNGVEALKYSKNKLLSQFFPLGDEVSKEMVTMRIVKQQYLLGKAAETMVKITGYKPTQLSEEKLMKKFVDCMYEVVSHALHTLTICNFSNNEIADMMDKKLDKWENKIHNPKKKYALKKII